MARKRKAGDGTVRQRKDGRWEGRVVIGYDDNGYPKTKNVLAKTKKECVEKLQKLKEECGGLKPEKVRPEMPFGDWLTYWYENHSKPKIRPTTQETYESRIRLHIIPEIGDIPLNKLTQNDLQQFYGRLKKSGRKRFTDKYGEGLSDRMVRMCHATCRSALEKAVQDGLIRVNPAIGCKLPPKKAREMQVLTREELQRFLIQAKFEGYYEVFLLDLATGLRRGELMALQWDDLNFKTGVLNVNKQGYDVRGQLQISTPKTKTPSARSSCRPLWWRCCGSTKRRWIPAGCFRRLSRRTVPLHPVWCAADCSSFWSTQDASMYAFTICATPSQRWHWKTAWM